METTTKTVKDPCIWCGESTAFGLGRFVNRIPADRDDEEATIDGWACAECAGYECAECGEQIYLDAEVRVDHLAVGGEYQYGNYHEACYSRTKHGPIAEY
jgi:hypothetical protein